MIVDEPGRFSGLIVTEGRSMAGLVVDDNSGLAGYGELPSLASDTPVGKAAMLAVTALQVASTYALWTSGWKKLSVFAGFGAALNALGSIQAFTGKAE